MVGSAPADVTQGSQDSGTARKSMRRGRAPGIADHDVAPHDEVSDCKEVFAATRPACKSGSWCHCPSEGQHEWGPTAEEVSHPVVPLASTHMSNGTSCLARPAG